MFQYGIEEVVVSCKLLKKIFYLKEGQSGIDFQEVDNISVTKVSFVTKFYQLLLFTEIFLWMVLP